MHYSESQSDYARTVAFRNRLGQWSSNNKHHGGCGLIWLTFVLQLYNVLQEYRPHVYINGLVNIHKLATSRTLYASIDFGHGRGGTPAIH